MNLYANVLYNIRPQESFRCHLKSNVEVFLFDFWEDLLSNEPVC